MKKIIVLTLCLALMLSLIFSVSAAEVIASGVCGENLTWALDNEGTLTISGTGDMWDWSYNGTPWSIYTPIIKKVVLAEGITNIGEFAFSSCASLESVEMPDGITSIELNAFEGCGNLESIEIPNSVTDIFDNAFFCCKSLKQINIPTSINHLSRSVFAGCTSLESIVIPQGVTSIGPYAFQGCSSLETVSIPKSVDSISHEVFDCCDSLMAINVDENNEKYSSKDGVLFEGKTRLLRYPSGKAEREYYIPADVDFIYYEAFWDCKNLENIVVDAENVGYYSKNGVLFDKEGWLIQYPIGNKRTQYIVPNNISIYWRTFRGCESLITVIIPENVKWIGPEVFDNCTFLKHLVILNENLEFETIGYSGTRLSIYSYAGSRIETEAKQRKIPFVAINGTEWRNFENWQLNLDDNSKDGVTGVALRTDITAMINNHAIPSYNVNGYTYIVAEDLKDYGFSVYYDNATRMLAINRDNSKTEVTKYYEKPFVPQNEAGIVEHDILSTDIVTYLDNNYVESYNINGQTIIRFDELKRYADVTYDNDKRLIWVHIPGLN